MSGLVLSPKRAEPARQGLRRESPIGDVSDGKSVASGRLSADSVTLGAIRCLTRYYPTAQVFIWQLAVA
jgi:hypothetical protein